MPRLRNSPWLPLSIATVLPLVALLSGEARGEESAATLWIDSDSYISYSGTERVKIPEGSSIRFRFGPPAADGSTPVAVAPADVSIAPIPIAEGTAIEYSLAEMAVGSIRRGRSGSEIELVATLVASLRGRPDVPPVTYELRFTTGRAVADSADRSGAVAMDGAPLNRSNVVTLVGAATNRADAYPGAGEAVVAKLSGRFDLLPSSLR